MALAISEAIATLQSLTPYSQSRKHDEPELEGELKDAYNTRTWRSQLHVREGQVIIPARSLHEAMMAAAKYSKKQIPGQGKATWTKKFEAGIAIFDDVPIGIKPEEVDYIDIYANADGIRGSGKRVMRRFPVIKSWQADVSIHVLDPIITEPILREMIELAGLFIGIGRYRPEKSGTNGRFKLVDLKWHDGRGQVAA